MYIDLARENELNDGLRQEAYKKSEEFVRFGENCFKQNEQPTLPDIIDKRVTLAGHGTLTTLGDNKSVSYTPEQLVMVLTQQSSLTKLPTTVEELDLIACDISLRPTAGKESYLEQFARLLNQTVGYEQVQVRGFQLPNDQNQYQSILVSGSGKVILLDKTQESKFNQLKREEQLLNKQLKANKDMRNKYSKIEHELTNYSRELTKITDDYNSQKTQLNEKIQSLRKTPKGRDCKDKKKLESVKDKEQELRELENEQGPKSLQFLKLTHNIGRV